MEMNFEYFNILLYATKNREICFGRTPNKPINEMNYKLKEFELKKFLCEGKELYTLSLKVQTHNGKEELFNVENIESIEFEIGERKENEFKVWLNTLNLEKMEKMKLYQKTDKEKYMKMLINNEGQNTYRLFLCPNLYFLDNTGESKVVSMKKFIYAAPIFHERDFNWQANKVFMAMPFGNDKYDKVYNNHIKVELENSGLEVIRVDKKYYAGDVMEIVWKEINEASFMVADVSNSNANVLYEIGIAHTLGKEVVILTDKSTEVPFDIRKNRYIEYCIDDTIGEKQLQKDLNKTIYEINKKINKSFKHESGILSISELERIEAKMEIGQVNCWLVRGNLIIVNKQTDEEVKQFDGASEMLSEVFLDGDKLKISIGTNLKSALISVFLDIGDKNTLQVLQDISREDACCELYTIGDKLKYISAKRMFNDDVSIRQFKRQVARI